MSGTSRSATSDSVAAPSTRAAATAWGVTLSVTGLALAILSALAIERLATHDVARGLSLLALVVVVRWISAEFVDAWFARAGARLLQYWRAQVVTLFLRAPEEANSAAQLADAIDTLVDEPRLGVVRASAQASILALVVVFVTGGWQALGIVLVLLAVAVPLYQRAGQRAAALEVEYRSRRTRLAQRQLELLVHSPELRALGAVDYGAEEIGALSNAEHQVALRAIRTALGSSLVTEFLGGVSVGLVAMDVGFGLLNGRISLLRALSSVLVTSDFFAHVRRYGVEFHRREAIDAAHARLELAPEEVREVVDVLVSAALVSAAHPAPVSLTVRRGERVAVLGPSGVGKTTLAHTWLGWRDARAGSVRRTDDVIAYVSADTALLEGTLGDNLRLGLEVDDARVITVLGALGLDSPRFARLDEPLNPDGEGVSSGERVRLLVARALLHHPRLLILDDVAGLLDATARDAVRAELARHDDVAIVELAVDAASFIDPNHTIELT